MLRLQCNPEHPDRGHWDGTLVEDLFGAIDDNIVLIPAKDQAQYIDQINNKLAQLEYCVVLIMSDEESTFPYGQLAHPRMKVWVQYPKEGRGGDRLIPAGYSPGIREVPPQEKTLEWFWGGQVTHQDRFELVEQLRKMEAGFLLETEGFTQGIELADYLELMAQAKLVPCPRGSVSPDTMRMYDALELGCTPVIRTRDDAFFTKLLGGHPFPVINSWSDLPDVRYQDCRGWWQDYKGALVEQMKEDIAWLKR